MSYHKTQVIGNLGKDPTMATTPTGLEVCNFSLASSRRHHNGTEEKIWFSVSVFGNQAKPCAEYLHQGSRVFVEGRLRATEAGNPHTFTKGNGDIGSTFNLTANQVVFLDGKEVVEEDEVSF